MSLHLRYWFHWARFNDGIRMHLIRIFCCFYFIFFSFYLFFPPVHFGFISTIRCAIELCAICVLNDLNKTRKPIAMLRIVQWTSTPWRGRNDILVFWKTVENGTVCMPFNFCSIGKCRLVNVLWFCVFQKKVAPLFLSSHSNFAANWGYKILFCHRSFFLRCILLTVRNIQFIPWPEIEMHYECVVPFVLVKLFISLPFHDDLGISILYVICLFLPMLIIISMPLVLFPKWLHWNAN